jgi:hypothetical protein
MAGGIDWFRWHHGSVTDPKFQLVARKAGARFGDVVTVWAYVLEAASASDERGQVGAIDAEAVDCMLGADDGTTARILDAMQARGLIDGGAVASWDKRQPKREDDTAAERKRRQREREHELAMAACVTGGESRNVTQGHDRGEESREEQIQEDPPASRVPPADAGQAPKVRASKRCPDSFAPGDEVRQWARVEAPRADFSRELAKFKDHTFQRGHSDWPAAFRNWLRRASDDAAKRPQSFMAEKKDEMAKWFKGTSLDTSTQQDYIDAAPLTLR